MFIKVIATIIILLVLVLGFVSTNPTVSGFFENVYDRFSGIAIFDIDTTQRDVQFSLDVNGYHDIVVKTRRNVNMTIIPENISLSLKDGTLKPDRDSVVYGFRGQMTIEKNTLVLDGKYDKFEYVDGSTSFSGGNIKTDGTFTQLIIDDFALNDLNLKNATGEITVNDARTSFSNTDLTVNSPLGTFIFSDGLKIDGSASKISIPSMNLVIG